MRGPAHGAIAAGISSACVTGYIRHHTRKAYDPEVDPPSKKELIRKRAPLAFAGLGFTGVSTAVAYSFDTMEKFLLGDSSSGNPLNQRSGVHRDLHSLPYIGLAFTTAKLILRGSERLGEWLASNLQVPDLAVRITDHLDELAKWVVNGGLMGSINHFLGDIPTGGRGGTALKLLAPIYDGNFAGKLISSSSKLANKWLTYGGLTLAGLSWVGGMTYILSWKPPEKSVRDYAVKLNECDNTSEIINTIQADFNQKFDQLIDSSVEEFWNRPLFDSSSQEVHSELDHHWFNQYIDPKEVFGISSYQSSELVKEGIWSENLNTMEKKGSLIVSDDTEAIPLFEESPTETETQHFNDSITNRNVDSVFLNDELNEDNILFEDTDIPDQPLFEDEDTNGVSLFESVDKEK